jgi:hypothetical protein
MDNFTTRVVVEKAFYDPEKQMLCMVLFLKLTGEKRIVYCPKSDWRYHDGQSGDFPDSEMYKFAKLITGREINWCMQDSPDIKSEITVKDKEELTDRVVKQLDSINLSIQENDVSKIILAEDQKLKYQNEVRDRIRKEMRGGK